MLLVIIKYKTSTNFAHCAVVPRLHVAVAVVAGVHEVLGLHVQVVRHAHRRVLLR